MHSHDSHTRPLANSWRRHALLALALTLGGIGLAASVGTDSAMFGNAEFVQGICLKSGIVLFMLWLAIPQLERLNPWTAIPITVICLIAIFRHQLLIPIARGALFIVPILFLMWLIRAPQRKS